MKALIWCGMIFLAGLLNTLLTIAVPQPRGMYLSYNEVMQYSMMRAALSMLIVWACVAGAKALCLQWDIRGLKKKAREEGGRCISTSRPAFPPRSSGNWKIWAGTLITPAAI